MLFRFISRKLRYFSRTLRYKKDDTSDCLEKDEMTYSSTEDTSNEKKEEKLVKNLEDNVKKMQAALAESNDTKVRYFRYGQKKTLKGALIYIDGMVNTTIVYDAILGSLKDCKISEEELKKENLMDIIDKEVLCAIEVKHENTVNKLIEGCLNGDTVLLTEGCACGLVLDSKGYDKRGVFEPKSETVVRGPREGYTEDLRTNTTLIRRKIRNGNLKIEHTIIGRKTRTNVSIIYLEGVANPKVVNTVRQRIDKLDVESILETGYIEEYIEDAPFSPFATISYSEKPDVTAAKILEGRVAIVVDGTPFVLTVPMLLIESFQTAEDYYVRPLYASLVRILRYIAYAITVFAPAIFVALTSFHSELIPTTLLFSIAQSREGTPFPLFLEALLLVFAFELLREAGVRLPKPVGQAISIVGAIIMGEAAVSAGIVGAPMVIVIAVTAVAGFIVPNQNDSLSIIRLVALMLAAIIGLYGILLCFLGLLIHLASLTSFGQPYFDSFGYAQDAQDTVVRMPLWTMEKRPDGIAVGDTTRIKKFVPPLETDMANKDGGDN